MKKINIKYMFLILLTMMPKVALAADYSYRGEETKVVYIIGVALMIIRVVTPILLILIASIDLAKALMASDAKEMKKTIKGIAPKVIAALVIFILPSLLLLLLKIINKDSLITQYSTCLLSPGSCNVVMWVEPPELTNSNLQDPTTVYVDDSGDKGKLEIVSITLLDTVVNVKAQRAASRIAGYYFSSVEKTPDLNGYDWIETNSETFKTVKYPGTYYIYVKDEAGNISEPQKVTVTTDFDVTLLHSKKSRMPLTFERQLAKVGSSVYEFNKEIATYNVKHGMRTRESVVVGAMAFISKVQSWGYYLPYSGSNDALDKDRWGIKKYWSGQEKSFLACNPYVVWSFKNAGLNIYGDWDKIRRTFTRTVRITGRGLTEYELLVRPEGYDADVHIYRYFVGVLGSKNSYGDNIIERHKGRSGDVLQSFPNSGHEMLIVDKYDDDMDGVSDGYIVLQSRDKGLCYEKVPYGRTTVYDLTNVYNNTAGFADYLRGWNAYHIPTSDYPDYLKELLTQK